MFLDYNQNAKDRTIASAYSVRPRARMRGYPRRYSGTRSKPASPADFTLGSMPARVAEVGDRHAGMDRHAGSLETGAGSCRRNGGKLKAWVMHRGRLTIENRRERDHE